MESRNQHRIKKEEQPPCEAMDAEEKVEKANEQDSEEEEMEEYERALQREEENMDRVEKMLQEICKKGDVSFQVSEDQEEEEENREKRIRRKESEIDRRYICKFCGQRYGSSSALKTHLQRAERIPNHRVECKSETVNGKKICRVIYHLSPQEEEVAYLRAKARISNNNEERRESEKYSYMEDK